MLIKKAVQVRKHLERNCKDKDSKFHLVLLYLVVIAWLDTRYSYYRTTRKLPANLKYESAMASTMAAA
jgi:small subunit ribosomal protein S13e